MRIFFLFLLILNLLFAAWQYYSPKDEQTKVVPLSDDLQALVLLKEAAPVVIKEPEKSEPVSEQEVEQAAPVKTCYTLGPYTDRDLVSQIEAQLGDDVIDLDVREREEQELHRYWVYLPGHESREKAREVSKALARKNIKDYYIIQKGDKKNSISLGHFKEKAYADARVKKLTKLGFDAQIEFIYRPYYLYWLDYAVSGEKTDLTARVQEYLVDGVTLLDRACEAN